ncbi:MAG: HD domain-containing phosphohydrolase [bacterium]
MIEFPVTDQSIEDVINDVKDVAHTGESGDGKIFVTPLDNRSKSIDTTSDEYFSSQNEASPELVAPNYSHSLTFKIFSTLTLISIVIGAIFLSIFILSIRGNLAGLRQDILSTAALMTDSSANTLFPASQLTNYIDQLSLNMILVLSGFTAFIFGSLYLMLQNWILNPLRKLLQLNHQTQLGKISYFPEEETRADEIGLIIRSRNEMLSTINTIYSEEALETLCKAVDAKDEYTQGHSRRVGRLGEMIGREYGLDQVECSQIKYSGSLHDFGKTGVHKSILNKDGPLTDSEFNEIKKHPIKGEKIIQFSNLSDQVINGIRHHHEEYDGSGYPDGLSGRDIPLFGRILAVSDAIDAMLSDRAYRDALDLSVVKSELDENIGTQFDPELANIALNLLESKKIEELSYDI